MKKQVGIWIDNSKAQIVTIQDGNESLKIIESDVENTHPKGGSGSSTPWGPQDAISESKVMERKKQQFKKFYTDIIDQISSSNQVYIIGPAEAKKGLKKALEESTLTQPKIVGFEASDKMTKNQLKARVRKFYGGKNVAKKIVVKK